MKVFFTVSAVFNFAVVLLFVLGQSLLFPLFGLEPNNSAINFMYFLMSVVGLFGVAYYRIANQPERYRELILFGAQAKLVLAATGVLNVVIGLVLWPILIPLAADVVFAAIFIKYYKQLSCV